MPVKGGGGIGGPRKTVAPKRGKSSVGKAVKKAGAPLKPKPAPKPKVSPALQRKPLQKADFSKPQQKARGKVRATRTKAVREGKVRPEAPMPRLPVLKRYTDAQREVIVKRTTRAAEDAIRAKRPEGTGEQLRVRRELDLNNPDGLRRLGDRDTRRALNKLSGAVDTRKSRAVDAAVPKNKLSRTEKVKAFNQAERDAVKAGSEAKPRKPELKVAGVPIEGVVRRATAEVGRGHGKGAVKAARVATAPLQATRAFVEEPWDTTKSSAKMAVATAKGAPAGVVQAVKDPKKAVKETGESYKRLYKPLAEGNTIEFRRQVQDEGAGVQVAFDTATAGSIVGKGVGAVAKGAGASVMTKPRPKLRVGAGPTAVRKQQVSSNILKAAGQRKVDKSRAKKASKRAGREEGMKGLKPGEGEVVKRSLAAQRRDQRIRVADRQSRGFTRLKRKQDEEIRGKKGVRGSQKQLRKDVRKAELGGMRHVLPDASRHAAKLGDDMSTLALQGLVTKDVKSTRALLEKRRKQVVDSRGDRTPARGADELVRIERVLKRSDGELARALPPVREFVQREQARDVRVLADDTTGLGGHRAEMRRWQPLGRTLGEHKQLDKQLQRIAERVEDKTLKPKAAEGLAVRAETQFLNRVKQRATELDLPAPVYVEHRPTTKVRHSDFTAGGARAVQGPKRTKYTLFDEGRYDTSPQAYEAGQARTLKRTVNWETAADILEDNSPKDGRGLSLRDAQNYIARENLDPNDWDVIDMNILRKKPDRDRPDDRGGLGDIENADIHEALGRATVDLSGDTAQFRQGTRTFAVVPRAVTKELKSATAPSGAFKRTVQKVQGGTSSVILNTNPLFVPVQVASNAILAVPGSRGRILTGPAKRWHSKLDPDTKAMVDEFLGSSPSADLTRAPRYGAAADNGFGRFLQSISDSGTVNAARESKLNPLTWNRRMDEAQNRVFRSNAFYARLERDLKRPVSGAVAEAQELAEALRLPAGPEKVARLRQLEPQIEVYARHVDDMLGNWTRYTVAERNLGRSALLFYGFMRFATKLALYTLPVKHPVATNIIRQLGQLNNEEVVEFLGSEFLKREKGYAREEVERAIRAEMLKQFGGRMYFRNGEGIGYVDLGRVSPLTSPIFDVLSDPRQGSFGLLSPVLGSSVKALLGEKPTGAKVNVKGLFSAYDEKPPVGLEEAVRIVGRDTFRLSPALRALDDALADGTQGDDTLPLVNDRPLRAVTDREKKKLKRAERAQPDSRVLRAASAAFSPVKLRDEFSLDRVGDSANYPERERLKREVRRLKAAGRVAEAKRVQQRISFLEVRAGMRQRAKRKASSYSADGYGGGYGSGKGY